SGASRCAAGAASTTATSGAGSNAFASGRAVVLSGVSSRLFQSHAAISTTPRKSACSFRILMTERPSLRPSLKSPRRSLLVDHDGRERPAHHERLVDLLAGVQPVAVR